MSSHAEGKIGKKGELYPPKDIREKAGFLPGDKVMYVAGESEIRVLKVSSILKSLKKKPFARIRFEDFETMSEEIFLDQDDHEGKTRS